MHQENQHTHQNNNQSGARNSQAVQAKSPAAIQKKANTTGMPDGVKDKMESSFGTDFSDVKVHATSAQAKSMGALAYAQGNNVHFAPGQFKPDTRSGQELIGHELAHVVQQRQGRVAATTQAAGMPVNDDPALEHEADMMGARAASHTGIGQAKMAAPAKAANGPVQKKDPETSDLTWNDFRRDTRSLLQNWLQEQIDAVQDVAIKLAIEENGSSQEVKVPALLNIIAGYIPATAAHKDLAVFVIEGIANGARKALGDPDKVKFSDFLTKYRDSQEALRRQVMSDEIDIVGIFQNKGCTESDLPVLWPQVKKSILQDLPNRNETKKAFISGWIYSASDVDSALPSWAQVEADFRAGSRAGYVYVRVKRIVGPGGRITWGLFDGPFIDDIDFASGTNAILKDVFGENTKITDLPYEMQVRIDSYPYSPMHRLSNPAESLTLGIKESTKGSELVSGQNFRTLMGLDTILHQWINSDHVPKVKDLVND